MSEDATMPPEVRGGRVVPSTPIYDALIRDQDREAAAAEGNATARAAQRRLEQQALLDMPPAKLGLGDRLRDWIEGLR